MTASRQLVRAFASIGAEDIPSAIAEKAILHIRDAVGVGVAASTSAAGSGHVRYGAQLAPAERGATLFSDGRRVDASQAALVNGGLIHSLEYDDTHTASIVHGSSVILPAALALAEEHGLSGAAFLRLYALGYEALVRLGLAAPGAFQRTGFQVTSVGGAMIVAAMAADAAGLDEDRSVAAVGISLSQASGAMEFLSNGSSVKSLHPGWAAHAGITAARLAAAGLTGPETSIEGRFGAMTLFSAGTATGALPDFATLGTTWLLGEVAMKFHPACHYLHSFIEGARILRERIGDTGSIARIVCRAPEGAAGIVCEPWASKISPPSGHAVRWSLPMVVAMALSGDEVGLAAFERMPTAEELALAAKAEWVPLENTVFPARFDAEIACTTTDGRVFEVRVDDAYGNVSRPATEADAMRKFMGNATLKLGPSKAEALAASFARLRSAKSARIDF